MLSNVLATAVVALALLVHSAADDAAGARQSGTRPLSGIVSRVADGDTLDVSTGRGTVTVRLDGIDAPEGGQPFAAEARRHLRVLCFSHRVTVLPRDTDRYGRLVARVLVGAVDVSEEMIRAGLAWHFTRYSSDRALAQLEVSARARRTGLWSDPAAVAPWTWRARENGRSASPRAAQPGAGATRTTPPAARTPYHVARGPYHGNVSSGVYHASSCRDYDCKHCTRVFATREEAEAAGFRPHQQCAKR